MEPEKQDFKTPEVTQPPQADILPTGAATKQTPPTSLLPSTPPTSETPKGNRWILISGIIIFVLGVLGVGGYWAYQNYLVPKPSPTPTTSPTPDVTASWKTYSNESAGFSFKYPPSITLKEYTKNISFTDASGNFTTTISWGFTDLTGTLEEEIKTRAQCPIEVTDGIVPGPIPNSLRCNFTKSHYASVDIWVQNGKKIYKAVIGAINPNEPIPDENTKLLDQILSTFKLLEVNATPTPGTTNLQSTVGWQKAENSTFSIKYPADKFTVANTDKFIQLTRIEQTNPGPDFLLFTNNTNSAQNWYLNYYSYSSSEIGTNIFFKQRKLGSFDALEVSTKTSPNYIQDIVVTKGSNLIDLHTQDSDLALMETLISTLVFK